jgi:hypothetical protein
MSKVMSKSVTVPRIIYEQMMADSELVRHLAHYRGYSWIEAAKKEMEHDKKCKKGAYTE